MDTNRRGLIVLVTVGFVGLAVVATLWLRVQTGYAPTDDSATITQSTNDLPNIAKQDVLGGLNRVWDVAFLPNKTLIFTERAGTISKLKDGKKVELLKVPNVYAKGEAGLLGLAVDLSLTTTDTSMHVMPRHQMCVSGAGPSTTQSRPYLAKQTL